jgi:hypothetical protein
MDDALEDLMAKQRLSAAQKDEVRAAAKRWNANPLGQAAVMLKNKGWGAFDPTRVKKKNKKVCHFSNFLGRKESHPYNVQAKRKKPDQPPPRRPPARGQTQ